MKLRVFLLTLSAVVVSQCVLAVPARPGFSVYRTADGTEVSLEMVGDEFGHWLEDIDGNTYHLTDDGTVVKSAQTVAQLSKARKSSPRYQASRPHRAVGTVNLAPRGIVILVNFKDVSMKSTNNQSAFNELMNGANYTYRGTYNSVREYFKAQSNGQYIPDFDVYGPVTISNNYAYYGANIDNEKGEDRYAANVVVEAVKAVDAQYDVDFTQYNNDGDSYIDFVYVIYAGKGEADGGAASTIWPHNWDLESAYYFGNCTYTKANRKVDGLYINNYAMSGEIDGQSGYRASIGTIAHEFGHVLGLPDLYDTDYSTNRSNKLTPGKYDIMDQGSYNGMDSGGYSDVGTCPPNYSPWERFFLGWETPVNLGTTPANLIFYPLGSSNYTCYQVNSSGNYQSCTSTGLQYYIENRQQTGWDSYLPGHGMLVWKLNYNASYWEDNAPNITSNGNPHYTLVSAYGTQINYAYNTYPGSQSVTEWKSISARPVTSISESGGIVTAKYMGGSTTITKYEQELSYFTAVNYETAGLAGDYEVYLYDPNGSLFAIADITTGNDYSLAGTFSVGTEAGAQYNSTIYIDGERQSVTSGNITFKYLGKSGETDIYQVTATDWYIPSLGIYYDMYGTVYGNAVWKTPFVNCGYTTDGCDDAIISVTDEFDNRCGDNLKWELSADQKTLTITGYGDMWDFTLTDMTDNTIPWVYAYTTIETVVLPDGITSIGDYAFFNHRQLTNISLPASLTRLGTYAFARNAFTSLTIPDAVTTIGDYAFAYAVNLTAFNIPKDVTSLGIDLFIGCSSLTQINYNAVNAQISDTYTTENPFYSIRSQITTFAFGNEVEVIPAGLCYGMTNLSPITLPAALTTLNGNAFYGCSSLTSITIPKNMNYIGKDVFAGCSQLTSVIWNAKTCQLAGTNTANTPFRSICEQITSFTIGDDVEVLPVGCCFGMTKLTSVTIPAQLSSLSVYCFNTCSSLQTVRFESSMPPSVHSSAFTGIPSTAIAQVPCGAKSAYETTSMPFASYTTFGEFPYTVTLDVQEKGTGTVEWLFTPDCDNNEGIVEATEAEGYTFSQWSDGNEENPRTLTVNEDMTLTAIFTRNQYTVTFQDEDGTVLQSDLWYYGETPAYNGNEPTKQADAEYTYIFAGWDKDIASVTEDATYTAVYSSERNQYTITFADEDGTVLQSDLWYYGETPAYNGNDPTKEPDAEYTYIFAGWDKDIATVTEDATYTAVYESEQNQYTVTFVDEDGTVLESNWWYYGETPIYRGAEPTKDADDEYTYTFAGWANAESVYPLGTNLPEVTGEATYTAVYESERNQYTVTFQDEDGTVLESNLWYYGETPIYNGTNYNGANPTKDADDEYTYTFAGWANAESVYPLGTNLPEVTGEATYTAVYESERNQYTVTFVDEDGTVLESNLWYYGETPIYRGGDPTKDADDEYTYTFAGWANAENVYPLGTNLPDVTGEATYTATYAATKNLSMNIVLEENKDADYYTQFAEDYNGVTVQTATLNRQFGQNKWSTICLPFDVKKGVMMSLGLYGRVFEYRYTEQLGEGTVQLFFSVAQSIEAGKGYIVSANAKLAAKTAFVFTNVTINTDADLLSGYDITALEGYNDGSGRSSIYLVGSQRTGLLKATNNGVTYLGLSNNKLYSPNQTTGTSIRAYRGFFRSLVPLNIQRVRIVAEGEPVVEMQVVDGSQTVISGDNEVRKFADKGILYIERGGTLYNAQGQRIE